MSLYNSRLLPEEDVENMLVMLALGGSLLATSSHITGEPEKHYSFNDKFYKVVENDSVISIREYVQREE